MLSEQISVTTSPTTLKALIETARSLVSGGLAVNKCIGIMLRYSITESAVVTMSDPDSVAGAVILDMENQTLSSATFKQFSLDRVILSASSTVTVHLIVEQALI